VGTDDDWTSVTVGNIGTCGTRQVDDGSGGALFCWGGTFAGVSDGGLTEAVRLRRVCLATAPDGDAEVH
jgi:hypothetical protein